MATLSRWSPFDDALSLRDAMNRLFEDSFVAPAAMNRTAPGVEVNVHEEAEHYLIEATVPGIKPDDIEITLHDNVLTISGEFRQVERNEGTTTHRTERRYGRFTRSFSLPSALKNDAVVANLEDGILTLTIPKAEEAKPRKITVQSGQSTPKMIESGR